MSHMQKKRRRPEDLAVRELASLYILNEQLRQAEYWLREPCSCSARVAKNTQTSMTWPAVIPRRQRHRCCAHFGQRTPHSYCVRIDSRSTIHKYHSFRPQQLRRKGVGR